MDRKTIALIAQLAANLKRKRLAKGLTQEELAHVSGFHRTYIGAVERGERNVTLSTLCALATSLNTSVLALLGEPDGNDE